jgi:hypothetical protein
MKLTVTVPSTIKPRINSTLDTRKNIVNYDADNAYPQKCESAINASGTASSCTDKLKIFLEGNGFVDQNLKKLIVNSKGETLSDIHSLVCNDRSKFIAHALVIGYNALLEVSSIQHIEIKKIRYQRPTNNGQGVILQMGVHPDWIGETYRRFDLNDIKWFDFYSDNKEIIASQIEAAGGFEKWNGQILYLSDSGKYTYPKAVCDSVLEYLLVQRGIKQFDYRNVETGFMAEGVFVNVGEFADKEDEENFDKGVEQFQGADRSHKILVAKVKNETEIPRFIPFESNKDDNKFLNTDIRARDSIIQCFGQPLALHSIQTAGSLGLSKEFEEAKTLYDQTTKRTRDFIANSFEKVLMNWHEGNPLGADGLRVIPVTGLSPVVEIKPLAERIGVGGITALQLMLPAAGTLLSDDDKNILINRLIVTFGLTPNEADAMITGNPIANGTT